MSKKPYTAAVARTKGRKALSVAFRHPLRRDARGKIGLKIRRGLKTSEEDEAATLVAQMNELLADASLHSLAKRPAAAQKYADVIVDAFYDAIETPRTDPAQLRQEVIPLPTREDGYSKILFVGTTGAGKTSLLRHMIGSDPKRDRFPSTSTSRTTISDIEVITNPGGDGYEAVITFFSEWSVYTSVTECISEACRKAARSGKDEEVAKALLHHKDMRFRLSYVLGGYKQEAEEEDEWAYEGEDVAEEDDEAGEESLGADERAELQDTLASYVSRIQAIAEQAKDKVEGELDVTLATLKGEELEAAQEIFDECVGEHAEFSELANDIQDDILQRFDGLEAGELKRTRAGWPSVWTYSHEDRAEFIRQVRWFASNHAPAFGKLLTPLVQGIRVRGPFSPACTDSQPKLVLMDGQGIGHTPEDAQFVSTHITDRYDSVDVILIVDSAKQPMQAAPLSVMRTVCTSGHQRKLAIALTHFDQVEGPNLRTFADKRAHVMGSIGAGLASLRDQLGGVVVQGVEDTLDARTFLFGWLDKRISKRSKGPVKEMEKLLAFCRDSLHDELPTDAEPVYDSAGLMFAVQRATEQFQELWLVRLGFRRLEGKSKEHWARIKALNRRIALSLDVEYQHLMPVAELQTRLREGITNFLSEPVDWRGPPDADQRQRAIERVQRIVSNALARLASERVLEDPIKTWIDAFDYSGHGSTFDRARDLKNIYEEAAPIPGEVMSTDARRFLREVRHLVHEAIKEGGGHLQSEVLA